jgi:hypothetical protein
MNEDDDQDDAYTEATLTAAIENQLEADDPAAVRAVLNKLTLVGYPREESVQLMAQVMAWEISAMLAADRPFDREAYEQALRRLPELPESDA